MPKYGFFRSGVMIPSHVVEGDYMMQNGENVTIYRNKLADERNIENDDQVACFRLDKGEVVREMQQGEGY